MSTCQVNLIETKNKTISWTLWLSVNLNNYFFKELSEICVTERTNWKVNLLWTTKYLGNNFFLCNDNLLIYSMYIFFFGGGGGGGIEINFLNNYLVKCISPQFDHWISLYIKMVFVVWVAWLNTRDQLFITDIKEFPSLKITKQNIVKWESIKHSSPGGQRSLNSLSLPSNILSVTEPSSLLFGWNRKKHLEI